MMIPGDIVGLISVYSYVAVLLVLSEKILKNRPDVSRKVLHIMVGNIAFILPIFQTKEIMAFAAAAPFIILTFLMSPYTPIKKIRGKTSAAGHGMGLVYYSITWTILAYFFFDQMEIIAIGILAMSYGDGLASLIGIKYGKNKYNLLGDEKSYVGSIAMFVFTFILMIIALLFYGITINFNMIILLLLISIASSLIEGVTPKGLDNLTVPFVASLLYWYSFPLM